MKEQLIEFNTAKLAQEKGFDVASYLKYDSDLIENSNFKPHGKSSWYLNITQSLLQKWLREVHNIHIWVNPIAVDDYKYTILSTVFLKFESEKFGYNTYELALETGLLEALKLIQDADTT